MSIPSDAAFLAKIAAVPGVKIATARIMFGGMANANDISTAAMFTAIDPVHEVEVCPRRNDMIYRGKGLRGSGVQPQRFCRPSWPPTWASKSVSVQPY